MFCNKCGQELGTNVNFCEKCGAQVESPKFYIANSNKRLTNFIFDRIGLLPFGFIVGLLVSLLGFDISGVNDVLLGLFISLGYFIFFEGIWQSTPAKWITKTKVVSLDGTKPKTFQIIKRSFSRLIPFEAFSFISGIYPRGWHDKLSNTLVVSSSYSIDDIKNINLEQLRNIKRKNNWLLIIALILGFVFIIGVLASIVLASLSSARSKGQDAAIKAELSNVQFQVQSHFEDNDIDEKDRFYKGFCSDKSIVESIGNVYKIKDTNINCNDDEKSYAISALLNSGKYFCVDSKGVAKEAENPLGELTSCY